VLLATAASSMVKAWATAVESRRNLTERMAVHMAVLAASLIAFALEEGVRLGGISVTVLAAWVMSGWTATSLTLQMAHDSPNILEVPTAASPTGALLQLPAPVRALEWRVPLLSLSRLCSDLMPVALYAPQPAPRWLVLAATATSTILLWVAILRSLVPLLVVVVWDGQPPRRAMRPSMAEAVRLLRDALGTLSWAWKKSHEAFPPDRFMVADARHATRLGRITPASGSVLSRIAAMERATAALTVILAAASNFAIAAALLACGCGAVAPATAEAVLCVCIVVRAFSVNARIAAVMVSTEDMLREYRHIKRRHEHDRRHFHRRVYHEMRVPVNAITLAIEMLCGHDAAAEGIHLSEAARDIVGMIREGTRPMLQMLHDMVDTERAEEIEFRVAPRPTVLRTLVSRSIHEMQPVAWARHIRLGVRIEDDLPQWMELDSQRVQQVLTNLLSNALKFTAADGRGRVRVEAARVREGQHAGMLRMAVTDNGCGFDAADLPLLVQWFQEVGTPYVVVSRGTDLGLAIVREIAHNHGGSVDVASRTGGGSTFSVYLPLRPAAEAAAGATAEGAAQPPISAAVARVSDAMLRREPLPAQEVAARSVAAGTHTAREAGRAEVTGDRERAAAASARHAFLRCPQSSPALEQQPRSRVGDSDSLAAVADVPLQPIRGHRLRVLVVDDVESNRRLLARVLRRVLPDAPAIDMADDGDTALVMIRAAAARNEAYRVVCIDNFMPRLSGVETVRALHAENLCRDAALIGCTGNTMEADVAEFLRAGVSNVCAKPVNVRALAGIIRAWLAAAETQRAAEAGGGASEGGSHS
jgi:signal transduction histidine kinase/FixJ family two-component response regulator